MINLNEIQENNIINNGKAGLVKNLRLETSFKTNEDKENFPNFKLIFYEKNGANIDLGLYYFKPKENETKEYNSKLELFYFTRLMHIVRTIMGKDFKAPEEPMSLDIATDWCFNIINENANDKLFNIFINYGTTLHPSKKGYLMIRFNTPFMTNVESDKDYSLLQPRIGELLEKPKNILLTKDNEQIDNSIITQED